jgi:hypothetical protein
MQATKRSNMSKRNNKKTKPRTAPGPRTRTTKKGSGRQQSGTFNEQAPVAIGNRTFTQKARIQSFGDRMVVAHSEYIGDIIGTTASFGIARTVALNPGIAASFPWLNQIASRYESYKFRKLHFRFNTERPTTESGYIALVPDYDPTDPQPVDKVSAFQYASVAKAAPWQNLLQVSSSADLSRRKTYFNRLGAIMADENISLFDTGNMFVCVGGNSGTVNLGQLWCDYEVEFMTPQLDSNYGPESAKVNGNVAQTAALPLGTNPFLVFGRNVFLSLLFLCPQSI